MLDKIAKAVEYYEMDSIEAYVNAARASGLSAKDILDNGLLKGMDALGKKFGAGEVFVPEVLMAAKAFIESNDVYDINIYGGEPFLNIELFDKVFQAVYDADRGFFVSSNGSFMIHKKKREYVYNLLRIMSYSYREGTSIRISNTAFHQQCRTNLQQRWFKILERYIKYPDEFWEDENDYDTYNPFYDDHGRQRIYIILSIMAVV
jgi:hypothetical protein